MSSAEHWTAYTEYTGQLTKFARQLAFGGAAICWFFKSEDVVFPNRILLALAWLVLYFVLDIVQYFSAAMMLRIWLRRTESARFKKQGNLDGPYDKPAYLDVAPLWLFVGKIIALGTGFAFIGIEILSRRI